MSRYAGQRALLFLIQGYRRHLSGRGLLRRVSCTFSRCESCSAYGLRVASESRSFMEAARLIRGRLRRCGEASLFRTRDAVLWGEMYQTESPNDLEASLLASREAPGSLRAALLQAARVAKFQGDQGRARAFLVKATRYPARGELLVRRGDGILAALRVRLRQFLCWPLGLCLASLGLFFGSLLPLWGLSMVGVGGLFWAAMIVARYASKRAFFVAQLTALSFLRPQVQTSQNKA